jgi:para-aminobenzoate synthetase component 1
MQQISTLKTSISADKLLAAAKLFSEVPGTSLLFSGGNYSSAKNSFLCLFPYKKISIDNHETAENSWELLQKELGPLNRNSSFPEWIGYLAYEMGATSDPEKKLPFKTPLYPLAFFQKCTIVISFDHKTQKVSVITNDEGFPFLSKEQRTWCEQLRNDDFWLSLTTTKEPLSIDPVSIKSPLEEKNSYIEKILHAKELITNGDIYQVNLSHECTFTTTTPPFNIFHNLSANNPASFSAFLNIDPLTIVSTSPERLLKKEGPLLETRPIKGTVPRGKSAEEDLTNRNRLLNSEKERAELLMITDLMRNDLGKISAPGSVVTEKIWACEAYTNVFHLLSIISSKALPNHHPLDLLRSCFPGGSITGCPKLRAMEVIYNSEQRPRGLYTGSIGYFAANGDFDFNIAIRTLAFHNGEASLQLGGGIVIDSDPEAEYDETLHKGKTILSLLGCSLL